MLRNDTPSLCHIGDIRLLVMHASKLLELRGCSIWSRLYVLQSLHSLIVSTRPLYGLQSSHVGAVVQELLLVSAHDVEHFLALGLVSRLTTGRAAQQETQQRMRRQRREERAGARVV